MTGTTHPPSLLFMGSKPLGLAVAREIAVSAPGALAALCTCDDTADARSCLPDFQAFARDSGLPLETLAKPSGLEALLDRIRPQAVIVCGWYWKISATALAKVPVGFLGVHASLLPRYRGSAPLVWAILNGEAETGVSLFRMEADLDTGGLAAQERFPIGPDDTIADALAKAETAILKALRGVLPGLISGQVGWQAQAGEPTYGSMRKPVDGILDWNLHGGAVHNVIRAQTRPYPGAFTLREGRKLWVWASARIDAPYSGLPGQVVEVGPQGAVVACGQGAVRLIEVQLEGGTPVKAEDILKYGDMLA